MKFNKLYESIMTEKQPMNEDKKDKAVDKLESVLEDYIDGLTDKMELSYGTLGDVKATTDAGNYIMSAATPDVAIYYGDGDAWEYFTSSSRGEGTYKNILKDVEKIAKKYGFKTEHIDDDDSIAFYYTK
jgi:hypothetical protein